MGGRQPGRDRATGQRTIEGLREHPAGGVAGLGSARARTGEGVRRRVQHATVDFVV